MSSAANALQAAIYLALTQDATITSMVGAEGIFDRRIHGKPMPYIVLAEIITNDFGPGAEEHVLTIEVWSDSAGRKQVQEIAGRIRELLHDVSLSLAGFTLVNLQHRSTRTSREPKTAAQRAILTFRAVTE